MVARFLPRLLGALARARATREAPLDLSDLSGPTGLSGPRVS